MSREWGWRAIAASTLVLLTAGRAAAGPSTILNTYVLFAQDNLRVRTLTLNGGDMGVNDGLLYMRGAVLGPQSDFAADLVHLDSTTSCDNLFANAVVGSLSSSCPKVVGAPVPHPLIQDLAGACGYQTPPTPCSNDLAKDVVVDHDQHRVLAPGTYRDLLVEGGGSGPAELKLTGGTYHFCNVRIGRNGSVRFQAPSTVFIDGNSRVSNAADVGPDPSLGASAPPPGAIKWFVGGSQARFSRKGSIALYACAPNAKMVIGSGTSLTGRFVARSIRLKKSSVTFAPPLPGVCGDTVISPDEQCEVDTDCADGKACVACMCGSTTTTTLPGCTDDEDCNQGSPGGGFICEDGHCVPGCHDDQDCNQGSPTGGFVCEDGHCVPGCTDDQDCNPGSTSGGFVCEDGHCVPGCNDDQDCNSSAGGVFVCEDGHCVTTTTTTTTGASTTTTPSSTTTTTTLKPCTVQTDCPIGVCRDGFCVPECDDDEDCKAASPTGSFVCIDGRCVPGGEICGDCIDNDGDGFIDFEDPDCCDSEAGQRFDLELRKGRFRPRSAQQSAVRLKGGLARSGLAGKIEPTTQQVLVQIRSDESGEVLCAAVPAGKFVKRKKQTFRFSSKRTPLPVEMGRNIDRIVIKVLKNGQVRFRVKGKRAAVTTPAEGRIMITLGFTRPGTSASQNACSQGVRVFRGGKKGQLTFP